MRAGPVFGPGPGRSVVAIGRAETDREGPERAGPGRDLSLDYKPNDRSAL